eukprot:scaffold194849_cov29-Tisochrysis_lutea.AAC.4
MKRKCGGALLILYPPYERVAPPTVEHSRPYCLPVCAAESVPNVNRTRIAGLEEGSAVVRELVGLEEEPVEAVHADV